MSQPWQADISITLTQAQRCIEQQFPDLGRLKKFNLSVNAGITVFLR